MVDSMANEAMICWTGNANMVKIVGPIRTVIIWSKCVGPY
jgi:hypothetical protein